MNSYNPTLIRKEVEMNDIPYRWSGGLVLLCIGDLEDKVLPCVFV